MSAAVDAIEIQPMQGPFSATVQPPGSKSITNRALAIAACAEGTSRLRGVLQSQDTAVMIESLQRLGVNVAPGNAPDSLVVAGCGGRFGVDEADLWLENSGTSIRFLTGFCAAMHGRYRLDGVARMRERPIGDLIDALQQLGLVARYEMNAGFPPVELESHGLSGGTARISGRISSQFLSALLMASPLAQGHVRLEITDDLVSVPYVEMTLAVMRQFGVAVQSVDHAQYEIQPQTYRGTDYRIEPDASAASYFLAAAAITGGHVTIPGLSRDALQGDVEFASVLERMGCEVQWNEDSVRLAGGRLRGIDVDMNAISDTAQTLAVVAPFADSPTRIRNVEHMRHKETDRVSAVVTELRRLGIQVEEFADGMQINPGKPEPGRVRTYDDHRMAMSFALLGLVSPGIVILDPACTGKTYPNFFHDLSVACGKSIESS